MAELIDKRNLQGCKILQPYKGTVIDKAFIREIELDELPTTTESDIRAKAIDEFAERILDYWDKRGTAQTILFLKDVADPLKEEQ